MRGQMEGAGGNSDAYRAASSISRRYGLLSASNIIQSPLSTLLEYSNLFRGRSNHQETEALVGGRVSAGGGFRDHLHGQREESVAAAAAASNDGEVSIRIIGAGEQDHDMEGNGLREVSASQNDVSVQSVGGGMATLPPEGQGDVRADRGAGEGVSGSSNGDIGDGAGANARDSSYQRYDIQQAAKWIEQVLPFSLLLLVVFIRQHLQGNLLLSCL